MVQLTILGDDEVTVDADLGDGRVLLSAPDLERATRWSLKPEGLCRGPVCVPVRDTPLTVDDGRIDLVATASALEAPLVIDAEHGVVAFGEPAPLRRAALDDTAAPDFTLPRLGGDHDGEPFTFSSIGAKKKLLVTWASW
jgi:hypothetical protein